MRPGKIITPGRSTGNRIVALLEQEEDKQEYMRNQQWLWEQQFQQMGVNPFAPMGQYGNFVPNYAFGLLPQQVGAWEEENEESAEAGQVNPLPPQRQANHVVSEDQDDIVEVAQPVAVETVRDGITAKLLKEQLHQVKETDTRSAKTDPEVASLLERSGNGLGSAAGIAFSNIG